MKILYLIRHAKSSWDEPNVEDVNRPLSQRGLRNAPIMGARLAKLAASPDLMISSPAKRAYMTACEISMQLDYDKNDIQIEKDLYYADVSGMIKKIHAVDNNIKELMIFGHNPHFTVIANTLSNKHIQNIPTCGYVKLSYNCDSWKDISRENCQDCYFDYPKNKD